MYFVQQFMRHDMTKPIKWLCAQRRLRSAWASTQSDQSLRFALSVAKDPRVFHADSKDTDQSGRMSRLIWVFAEGTLILLVLSCRGSYGYNSTILSKDWTTRGLDAPKYRETGILLVQWIPRIAKPTPCFRFKRSLLSLVYKMQCSEKGPTSTWFRKWPTLNILIQKRYVRFTFMSVYSK